MILAALHYYLAGIWPLIWHFGIGGIVVIGCVVLYAWEPALLSKWFPNIQKILIWVAALTVAAMIFTAIGVSIGEKRIQAQWAASLSNAVEAGKQAHNGAVSDVARKPHRWLPNHADRHNRDGH